MKKIILLTISLIVTLHVNAQFSNPTNPTTLGSVGIGTTDFGYDKLRIATGEQYFRVGTWGFGLTDSGWRNTLTFSNNYDFHEIYNNDNKPLVLQYTNKGGVGIGTNDLRGDDFHVSTGEQYFRVGPWGFGLTDSGWRNTLTFSNNYDFHEIYNNGGKPLVFQNQYGGNVGIGTTEPKNKLSVNGTIWAKEVKVSLVDAADWVFEDDYNLRSLEDVEIFVKSNKHLPDVPSADEFRKNDLNVAEMDNKLLQKIEELTLYLIEQNKQIVELKTKVTALENK